MNKSAASKLGLAVLISGNGSNLQALIDRIAAGTLDAEIRIVISNTAGAYGLQRAARAGIPHTVVDHTAFASREAFDAALIEALERSDGIDLVVLAGFMRILTAAFIDRYAHRIINIHPSLLPKYPGLDTHQRVLEAGDQEHGASVHFVTTDLDAGPVIIQARVPVKPDDTPERLQKRVHSVEYQILPQAIQWIAEGRLQISGDSVLLDGAHSPQQDYLEPC